MESVTTELLVQPASVQALRRRVCGVYTPRPEQRHKTWDSNKSGKRELFSKSDPPPNHVYREAEVLKLRLCLLDRKEALSLNHLKAVLLSQNETEKSEGIQNHSRSRHGR